MASVDVTGRRMITSSDPCGNKIYHLPTQICSTGYSISLTSAVVASGAIATGHCQTLDIRSAAVSSSCTI